MPDGWERLRDPAGRGDLTPEQVAAAAARTTETTSAVDYFVLRPVANQDLVVTAPRLDGEWYSPVLTLARRDDGDLHQHWALGQGSIGGGLLTYVYINRATAQGIGRTGTSPVAQVIDDSNHFPTGWIPQGRPNSMDRVYAILTRDPVYPAGTPVEQHWIGRRAMAPVDPQAGSPLKMVDGKLAYDTRAYQLEQVFL
ncbi:hypothetical protein [Embleya scabrispora]|uniref:hypothetical protein n=1 Tax=Embleya scabrispora TaxID=159449 RepID=UPI0003743275|nr:hypothetical protein [Embleya scabrispora]MYS80772.1 hypothetical protein [Streptomyces sp. SID5474]